MDTCHFFLPKALDLFLIFGYLPWLGTFLVSSSLLLLSYLHLPALLLLILSYSHSTSASSESPFLLVSFCRTLLLRFSKFESIDLVRFLVRFDRALPGFFGVAELSEFVLLPLFC